MALTLGRAGLDIDLNSPAKWNPSGDRVTFEVWISSDSGLEEQNVLVEQLVGLVANPDTPVVPVTWDAWPAVDGFYRILDLDLTMVGASAAGAPWRLSGTLERVSAFAAPVVESRLLHVARANSAVAASAADPIVGVPGSATLYRRGTTGRASLSTRSVEYPTGAATAGSVLVDVWAATDDQADAEWQVAPADFYEGAAQINRRITDNTTRAILGRQVPGGLDPNTDWAMGNGLVSVLPSERLGGTAGTITVLSWGGTAFESATEIEFQLDQASIGPTSSPDSFMGWSILQNGPDLAAIRLTSAPSSTGLGIFTLDLAVRRGDRLVHGVLRTADTAILQVTTNESYSALIGGLVRNSNDADGNRWVLTTGDSTLTVIGTGGYGNAGGGNLIDFGFGHVIDYPASGIDTAQALANQYAAHVAQADQIVIPVGAP